MKTKSFFRFLFSLLTINALCISSSCNGHDETTNCFPDYNIYVVLNLNLPAYFDLQNTSGWIYVNEQEAGTRGLVAVRTINGFKIYDRNAPHLCPDTDTTLEVKDNNYLYCPRDNSKWMLLTGQPDTHNPTGYAPKTYPYNYDATNRILTIYN